MILVDSSVWIDFFRGTATAEAERLDALLGRRRVRSESFGGMRNGRGGLMIGGERKCAEPYNDDDSRRCRGEQARVALMLARGGLVVVHEKRLLGM